MKGVSVFALPSGLAGVGQQEVEEQRYGLVRTDAEGAFALVHGDLESPRLVAWAEGALPASVDLDGRRPEDPVEIVLGDPWRVTLRVESPEGIWPDECEVTVWTNDDDLKHFAADPHDADTVDGYFAPPFGGAERTVPVPTLAPVYVEVTPPEGYASVPPWVQLEHPAAHASFRLVRTSRLTLHITDAESKAPFPADVEVFASVHDADRGLVYDSGRAVDGVIVFDTAVSPGRHILRVSAAGRLLWQRVVEVTKPGQEIIVPVALERPPADAEPTHVLVRIQEEGEPSKAVTTLAAQAPKTYGGDIYRVLLRPAGTTTWRTGDPMLLPDGRIELRAGRRAELRTGHGHAIEPGVYDVLVAQRRTGMAGYLSGVPIYADQENELVMTLEPGSLFRLNDLVSRDAELKHVVVRSATSGLLPLFTYRRSPGPQQVYVDAPGVELLLRTPREPLILGPFPAKEVEVVLTDATGRTTSHRVRGAP